MANTRRKRLDLTPEEIARALAEYRKHVRACDRLGIDADEREQWLSDFFHDGPDRLITEDWDPDDYRISFCRVRLNQYVSPRKGFET